jgi:hypothetical protein
LVAIAAVALIAAPVVVSSIIAPPVVTAVAIIPSAVAISIAVAIAVVVVRVVIVLRLGRSNHTQHVAIELATVHKVDRLVRIPGIGELDEAEPL